MTTREQWTFAAIALAFVVIWFGAVIAAFMA